MYNQTLHHDRKQFPFYYLQSFTTAQILEWRVNSYFGIYGKQIIKATKIVETVKFKNSTRKVKSPFMIYAHFESILISENNGKQKQDVFYTNKYQNHIGCSFGYKYVYVDDQFSKAFKSYLGQ